MRFPRQNDSHTAKVPAALVGLGLLLCLAVCELVASGRAYRSTISVDDWQQLSAHLREAADEAGPNMVVVARPWLRAEARRELAPFYTPDVGTAWQNGLAPPDFAGLRWLWLVSPAGERSLPSWLRRTLEREAKAMPADALRLQKAGKRLTFGGLQLQRYGVSTAATQLASFSDILKNEALELRTSDGPCRAIKSAQESRWRCPGGYVRLRYAEFDHHPRRCLEVELPEGAELTFRWPLEPRPAASQGQIRGHIGFSDFNARLRSAAPVKLGVYTAPDKARIAQLYGNFDHAGRSWQRFNLAHGDGSQTAELRITMPLPGRFERGRYAPRSKHLPCLEWRQFAVVGSTANTKGATAQ